MLENFNPIRYAVIHDKNPREILMLRGTGCKWRRCTFCDYHFDCDPDEHANFLLNQTQIDCVTGLYHKLEVINSGSFVDLDEATLSAILTCCKKHQIDEVHFECHWAHRADVPAFRAFFGSQGINVKLKIGVETFDRTFRETRLVKGIDTDAPEDIAAFFDEVCLLQGLTGQTAASMKQDIEIGLTHFERVCVNIMQQNTTEVQPDPAVISAFTAEVMPLYIDHPRVDILMENTEFGVGADAGSNLCLEGGTCHEQ